MYLHQGHFGMPILRYWYESFYSHPTGCSEFCLIGYFPLAQTAVNKSPPKMILCRISITIVSSFSCVSSGCVVRSIASSCVSSGCVVRVPFTGGNRGKLPSQKVQFLPQKFSVLHYIHEEVLICTQSGGEILTCSMHFIKV